jgi:betaine-aldehyde dehydrogenase
MPYCSLSPDIDLKSALWKSGPCLAAGNTMIYKPSEFTPLHAQTLAQVFLEAGLPAGAFNVVYGAGDIGSYLTTHPSIAKVSFTGQVPTGLKVAGSAAGNMKYVTMELGGKSPLIILPDAELENAVDGAMMANFYSTGQVCTNGTRVFVPRSMKSAFEKRLLEKMQYVRPGPLFDDNTNYGPLSSATHCDKVTSYIRAGIETDKATLLCGGLGKPQGLPKDLENGYWVKPTVFTDCTDSMRIVREEIFGPVMSVLYFDTAEEAVRRANDTEYGLAAGVFTKDINQAHRIVDQLQAGITWVNTWGDSPSEMSVGGWKKSGLGVENGRQGIEAWVTNKSTLVDMSGAVPTVFAKL